MPLYWRVVVINAVVFVLGTVALALAPVTVSARVLASEAVVLAVGLTAILVVNALLLRSTLRPLDRAVRLMERVDLRMPGERLPETGAGPVAELVEAFNAMLERLEAERSASTARALAAQEAERHRIARELHDEIGQGLTAMLLGLKRAIDRAPDEVRGDLELVQQAARGSLEEVRQVARRLRPGVLEDLGLLSALAASATDLSTHSRIHVERGLASGLPDLGPDAELVVYRVAQEAMTNIARHSDADTVWLSLSRQGDNVALLVADNGRGTSGLQEGAGIRGMKERARLVGADLTVRPRPEGGTEVRLVVPIKEDADP
ncbi:histidine kinase [Knoellia subterranea KCTC 19937]|uniref:histidine kinase n=2 Tax=Knoellia TaxID=136099 RepID=A0A0A0JI21_9MICO|nr:histidine kinase [Knoellia subterranea KCTC 19937]